MQAAHFGLFWREIQKDFPKTDTKPPLDPASEPSEIGETPSGVSFQVMEVLPLPRVWFESDDESELVQIQSDRLVFNWRPGQQNAQYPRFPAVFARFQDVYGKFEEFVHTMGIGPLVPVLGEVTYVNQVPVNDPVSSFGDLGSIFRFWGKPTSALLGVPEQAALRMAFKLHSDERYRGRLHVHVDPRFRRSDKGRVLNMTITVRGHPFSSDRAGVEEFLAFGHKYVVRAFADLTSPELQELWGRDDI